MLPGFVTEYLSKDDVGFTQGLFQTIIANSTVTQDTPFSYLEGKPKTKPKAQWGVHFKGRTLGEKKDVFVKYSGLFAKKDPKTRGDFRKRHAETDAEKAARIKQKKWDDKHPKKKTDVEHQKFTMVYDPILKKMVPRTDGPPTVVIPPVVIQPVVIQPVVPPVVPPVVIPKQTPRVPPPTAVQNTDLTALQEYIKEQHGVDVTTDEITQAKFPWLAFSAKGEPLLYGDADLHNKLGLPDAYRVVRSQTGILHTAYDPQKVKPKFFKVHSVGAVTY
jgi:hypothetical protein